MISIYYAQRENVEMLNKAIQACKKQIKIGPLTKVALRKDYEKSQIENRKCSKDPLPHFYWKTLTKIIALKPHL